MENTVEDSKILIVEDNPDLLEAYKRIIGREGYRVYEATNGADGLKKCYEVMPDLVLLDAVLPDADGEDICRQIKAAQDFRTIFVIMVSGQKHSPEHQALFLETGADGFLQKPIDQKVLL